MKHHLTARFGAALLMSLLVIGGGFFMHRPAARADDKAAPAAAAPVSSGSLAGLLTGKPYPATLPAAQVDSSFQMVDLVDAQGKPGTYVTKGETAAAGGETFLVAYFVVSDPGTPANIGTVPRGSTLRLALINMRFVQAMTNPRPVAP